MACVSRGKAFSGDAQQAEGVSLSASSFLRFFARVGKKEEGEREEEEEEEEMEEEEKIEEIEERRRRGWIST